jgi:hypothetical protein
MATNTFVGLPQPDRAHKPLLNLVNSARMGARTSDGATLFVSAAKTLSENAVGDLATDSSRSHPERMNAAYLVGHKDRDRADG